MTDLKIIFLDLDGTIYPNSNGLWQAIGNRINRFMVEKLAIDYGQVEKLRDEYLQTYGTTLNGLIVHRNVDPFEYLRYVHDVPLDRYLKPDPELNMMLASIPQKRVIFTNGSHDHANRVLRCLGIESNIDHVIDIVALNFINKPRLEAYELVLSLVGEEDPSTCLIADDRIVNLFPAGSMGMTTVLVGEEEYHPPVDFHIEWITGLSSVLSDLIHDPRKDDHDRS